MVSRSRLARQAGLLMAFALQAFSTGAVAHSQYAAAFDLREVAGRWVLDVQFGNADTAAMAAPECRGQVRFEQCLTAYLRRTIVVRTDEHVRSIGRGAIRLGSHVSEAVFELDNTGNDAESLDLTITSFASLAPGWLNYVRVRAPRIAYDGVFDQRHSSFHVDGDALKARRRARLLAVAACLSVCFSIYLMRRGRGADDGHTGLPSFGPADQPG